MLKKPRLGKNPKPRPGRRRKPDVSRMISDQRLEWELKELEEKREPLTLFERERLEKLRERRKVRQQRLAQGNQWFETAMAEKDPKEKAYALEIAGREYAMGGLIQHVGKVLIELKKLGEHKKAEEIKKILKKA